MVATPQTNSRLLDDTHTFLEICDTDHTGFDKANFFILCAYSTGDEPHGNDNATYKLEWRRAGGTFADVGADTEIKWGSSTDFTPNITDENTTVTTDANCLTATEQVQNVGNNALTGNLSAPNGVLQTQWGLGFGTGALDNQEYELQLTNTLSILSAICSVSITTAAGSATYDTSLPSTLRVLVTQQKSLPSTMRVNVTQQKSLPSLLRVTLQVQLSLPSTLRVNTTQETFLPTTLDVRVEVIQLSQPSTLRVNVAQQLSLPSTLRVVVATTEQKSLPSTLRVNVTQETSLPTVLRVKVIGQQISLPSLLRVTVQTELFLPTTLRVIGAEQVSLPSKLAVRVSGLQTSLPSILRVMIQTQLSLPTIMRIVGAEQTSLPTVLRVKALSQQLSLPSVLRVGVFYNVNLPTILRVKVIGQQTLLPSTLIVRIIDNQLSLPSTLRVILTQQLSLSTTLRVKIFNQQTSLPTSIRVKVLANQLTMSSSLRVTVQSQISVPTTLRVKTIGIQISKPTTLRIKVIGQQLSLPSTLKVLLRNQLFLPSKMAVRVSGLQVSLPSTLRIIVFVGQTCILPTTMRVKVAGQHLSLPSTLRVEVPPLFTIDIDDTDVGIVRKLMAQAGREVIRVHEDDILPVFYSGSDSHLYTDFQDIMDVQHIRLVNDIDYSGTNYLQGSTVYEKEGRIDVGLTLPANTTEVLVTYATRDGLDDDTIQYNINMAKFYLQGELWREMLDFSGSSTYEQMAKWTLYSVASYWSILAMNSSNAIQSGYNYRIAEFEIQTKLWGEGMIAETLLNKYWERSMKMINALKLFESNPEPPLYVIDRSNTRVPYNKDPTVFHTMTSMEAVTLYDSVSRYAVILRIYG